jgi:predicted Zn-dependent peptidase
MLDVFLNALFNFQLDSSIYEHEKKAVKKELDQRRHSSFGTYNRKLIFRKSRLRGVEDMDGRIKNVDNITINDLLEFRKKFYSSRNMYFCICGDFNVDQAYSEIKGFCKEYFYLDYHTPQLTVKKYPITKTELCNIQPIFSPSI